MFLTAVRRRSWNSNSGTPAAVVTVSQAPRKSRTYFPLSSEHKIPRLFSTISAANNTFTLDDIFRIRALSFFVSPGFSRIVRPGYVDLANAETQEFRNPPALYGV